MKAVTNQDAKHICNVAFSGLRRTLSKKGKAYANAAIKKAIAKRRRSSKPAISAPDAK